MEFFFDYAFPSFMTFVLLLFAGWAILISIDIFKTLKPARKDAEPLDAERQRQVNEGFSKLRRMPTRKPVIKRGYSLEKPGQREWYCMNLEPRLLDCCVGSGESPKEAYLNWIEAVGRQA